MFNCVVFQNMIDALPTLPYFCADQCLVELLEAQRKKLREKKKLILI
jgi:hypothetical protein